MKKTTINSIIVAIIVGSAAVTAHAKSYDPSAPDRYSATLPVYNHAAASESTAHPAGIETRGFRPFDAHRYTSSSHIAGEIKPDQAVMAGTEGNSFNPFAANRYTR